jgi:hypothetical protein
MVASAIHRGLDASDYLAILAQDLDSDFHSHTRAGVLLVEPELTGIAWILGELGNGSIATRIAQKLGLDQVPFGLDPLAMPQNRADVGGGQAGEDGHCD